MKAQPTPQHVHPLPYPSLAAACFFGTILLGLGSGGCPQQPINNGNDGNTATPAVAALKPFASKSELDAYFRAQTTQSRSTGNLYSQGLGAETATAGGANPPSSPSPSADTANSGAAGGSTVYSTTNLQEAGVDESDVFKSDGTNFFLVRGNALRIVKAAPGAALAELGRLEFDHGISELYLTDHGLLALGYSFAGYGYGAPVTMIYPPYYSSSSTTVYQVNITDLAHPAIEKQTTIDGSLVTSRLLNDRLVLVLSVLPNIPVPQTTILGISVGGTDSSVSDALPKIQTSAGSSEVVSWENWLHPDPADGYEMTVVVALDAGNVDTVISSTGIIAGAETIYASPNALYVTDSAYDSASNYREFTNIHKFAFQADGSATYKASGLVPGRPLNQFSLGEFNGDLRISTHVENVNWFPPMGVPIAIDAGVLVVGAAGGGAANASSADASTPPDSGGGSTGTGVAAPGVSTTSATPTSYNGVYVLRESTGQLATVGTIDNIAPGERLYAARFLDKRGYLVTFRQIDPLYALDLSDPAAPKITGELKVPGYSDYLHPLDDTHLIGVGRSVVNFPQGFSEPGGVQLSLFDVSNPANPTVVQQIVFGGYGSSTDVSATHKAFVYQPELKVLTIPVQLAPLTSDIYSYGYPTFDGVIAFHVDPATGFSEIGRLDSVLSYSYPYSGYYGAAEGDAGATSPGAPTDVVVPYGYASWRRPAIIGDTLYAVTDGGVARGNLDDLAHPESLTLAP